ncbi:MAG TPA: SBBP repeat-containing protein [Syntrophorhabdaceae bacterium]
MKRSPARAILSLTCFLLIPFSAHAKEISPHQVKAGLRSLSVPFIANEGQVDKGVSFYARTFAGTVFVGRDGVIQYAFGAGSAITEEAVREGTVPSCPRGVDPSSTKIGSFLGNDPSRWKGHITAYESIALGEIQKGVTLSLKAHGDNVEKLFTVSPGASPSFSMKLSHIERMNLTESGELEVTTGEGSFFFSKPVAFQEVAGKRQGVVVAYALTAPNSYGFAVGPYDREKPLVIDPYLASTFFGATTAVSGMVTDISGNVYVTGTVWGSIPVKRHSFQKSRRGAGDAFIAKLDGSLTALLASTYFGGSSEDEAVAVALDASGNVYASGWTASRNFPTTPGAYSRIKHSSDDMRDTFISKFDASLMSLTASTYLGGTGDNSASSVAVSASEEICVSGITASSDFPTTEGAYSRTLKGESDAFISKLDSSLSTLLASTYLGGAGQDYAASLVLDPSGNAYVTGITDSPDFPVTAGAYLPTGHGGEEAFISRLNSGLTALLASTYLGGSAAGGGSERGEAIALDASGNVYVAGGTASTDFPTTEGAYLRTLTGEQNGFVSKLNGDLTTLVASTYLEGGWYQRLYAMTLNPGGDVYVAGNATFSYNPTQVFPEAGPGGYGGNFIFKLNGTLSTLLGSFWLPSWYSTSTSLNSIAFDPSGNLFAAGETSSSTFPTTEGAYQKMLRGQGSAFITKIDSALSPTEYTITARMFRSGKGTVSATGLTCRGATCTGTYPVGAEVVLTAEARPGSAFDGWRGCTSTSGNTCTVRVDMPHVVVALFYRAPRIAVTPSSLSFGAVQTGGSLTREVRITNRCEPYGNMGIPLYAGIDIIVGPISITGDSFSQTNNCSTVACQEVCTVNVTFSPSARGSRTGRLNIISNDPARPEVRVNLGGRGK